jgi:hypothetical protein
VLNAQCPGNVSAIGVCDSYGNVEVNNNKNEEEEEEEEEEVEHQNTKGQTITYSVCKLNWDFQDDKGIRMYSVYTLTSEVY